MRAPVSGFLAFNQHSKKFTKTALASILALTATASFAADAPQTLEEAKAEIQRLQQENQALKQQNTVKTSPPAETEAQVQTVANETNQTPDPITNNVSEVVIRATKTTAPIVAVQDTPASISIVSGEELQRFETNNFQGILKKIGNVRWAGASSQNHPLHTSL